MLKRSFAEFHAQRSHPEALQKLAEGKARLDALRARPWPHSPHATSQHDVQEYYHLCEHIRALTTHIQVWPEAPMFNQPCLSHLQMHRLQQTCQSVLLSVNVVMTLTHFLPVRLLRRQHCGCAGGDATVPILHRAWASAHTASAHEHDAHTLLPMPMMYAASVYMQEAVVSSRGAQQGKSLHQIVDSV